MIVLHVALWWSVREKLRAGYQDFTIFYAAGTTVLQGGGSGLYDSGLQSKIQRAVAPDAALHKGPLPYLRIPVEAVIFVPFAKLPYFRAYLLWDLLNLLALFIVLLTLRPHLSAFSGQPLALGIVLALAFFPVFAGLLQGQDILLLVSLLALTYRALRRDAGLLAGCWLGLGLFRFTLVLPLALILAWRRPWKLMAGFGVTGGLMGLLSIAVVGWKAALHYPSYAIRAERASMRQLTPWNMPNLRGLVSAVLRPVSSGKIVAEIAVLLTLALLWYCLRQWNRNAAGDGLNLWFSLATVAAVLSSYHAYAYDLSVLLIPILLVANDCLARPTVTKNWAMMAPIAVLFFTPLHVILWFRMQLASLWAVVLLFWLWAIAREISRADFRSAKAYPGNMP